MRFLKRMPVTLGMSFLVIGSFLFVADIYHIRRYGIGIFSGNSYVTEDGQVADAPEAPFFLFIPAYVYSLVCWVMAAIFFAFLPLVGKKDAGRVRDRTE